MWVLSMEKFLQAAEKVEENCRSLIEEKKDRVIRLLMGDEEFLAEQTLEDIADIINNDAEEVFEEYDCRVITTRQLEELPILLYMKRRRLL